MSERVADDSRTARFRAYLARTQASIADVAALTGRSKSTVWMWRLGRPKSIPEHMIQLLEAKEARP
jgi:hypothetical protein